MNKTDFFVTGGALQADAGCYVPREADARLLNALRQGEFCYVLTSRQMGKSSLMIRTAVQLREEGWAVVIIDLTSIGQNLDVDQWYFSMLCHVGEKLNLEKEMEEYWDANARRAPLHRFMGAIREVYLEHKRKPLVIFVDEIDAVRSLQRFSADEFFAGIRECYNRRPENPKLERLTFCLLGVATPSDLIRDERITPFNIGQAIELGDFTPADSEVLAGGLSPHRETAHMLLERVLWWTGGQPYLTQKLCAEVAKAELHRKNEVDGACEKIFLSPEARERDDNLHFVRDRLLRSEIDRAALLDAYARVCRADRVSDDRLNPVANELRLSGVVRVIDGFLRSRNRIYAQVFDLNWVKKNLPDAETRRQRAAYYRGVRRVAGAAVLVLAVMGTLAFMTWRSASAEKAASQRAKEAAENETKAHQKLLEEAERTNLALDHFVKTQSKVEALLGALTPLVGDKSGKFILERAEEVVQTVTTNETDNPRIVVGLAGLRRVCGQLYLRLGNEEAAMKQAKEARGLLETQIKNGNTDPALKRQLHDCIAFIGDTILGGRTPDTGRKKSDADYAKAIAIYRETAEFALAEVKAHPDDQNWRSTYFADLINLGDTAELFGPAKSKDAEQNYKHALTVLSDFRRAAPNSPDLNSIEALLHDRLGTLYLEINRNSDALSQFDLSLRQRQSGASEDLSDDPERQSDLATSYNKLGNAFSGQEKYKEALDYYERSLVIRRKLCEQDKRRDWQRNLGFTLTNVCRMQWRVAEKAKNVAQLKGTIDLARERLDLAQALHAEDPSDSYLKLDYANALYLYGDLLLNISDNSLKDWPRALDLLSNAVNYTERRDPTLLTAFSQALRLAKRLPEAKQAAEEAAKLLPPIDKRTWDEKEIAKNIEHELFMDRAVAPNASTNRARRR